MGSEGTVPLLLFTALIGGESSALFPGRLTNRERAPWYQMDRRQARPNSWSGRCKGKPLASVRNRTLPSRPQPVAIPTELSRLSFVEVPFKRKSAAFIAKPI
jgi:hypothetical protein